MKTGMVYLAGAGPGDPGLITLSAVEALEAADCVIYDFLANPAVLDGLACEKIYVGKQGSDHTLPQEEINALMIKKAKEGKTVVRLKGGDPFIFGRGGEEAEELARAGVPFRVIPGVSSFYAAPAYAGIPMTHRDFASAFEVITGHRRADAPDEEEMHVPPYDPQKTYAFLMGMKNLGDIAQKLITEKNFPADTPAAVITWGTTPRQRTATGALGDIARRAKESGLAPPAIILVGRVVTLRSALRWFDALPLFGKKIVVTRTREQASKLSKKLAALGAEVIELPTIEIRPRADQGDLIRAIGEIGTFDWIIFTSQNAVKVFFRELARAGKDGRALHGNKIAAIGPATAGELGKYFLVPDLVPPEFVAEAMIAELAKFGVTGRRVLIPCAAEARDALRDGLAELGAEVRRVPVYDTVVPERLDDGAREAAGGADIVTFTSSSTARNFFALGIQTGALFASIGPVTSATVRESGKEVGIEAREYTIDGLVEAISEHVARGG